MATDLANLIAIRSSLLQQLANETAYVAANGGVGKPSYSLDGESYSWTEWRTAVLAQVKSLNELIQGEQTPFVKVSRVRP